MVLEHHDLAHEFPEFKDRIHTLKTRNAHFARLFDEYHQADREVRRMEQGVELATDEAMEDMKKLRLSLKDQLYDMLKDSAS